MTFDSDDVRSLLRLIGRSMPAHVSLKPLPKGLDPGLLARWEAALPPAQFRVVRAFLGDGTCPTRREVAAQLGVHLGTVHTHLRRIRNGRPAVWREIEQVRRNQRAERHRLAVERETARSERWHRRQGARRFRERFGRYPWE